MHLHTIVKVRARDEKDAVEKVTRLVTTNGEYYQPEPFDWFDEDGIKVRRDFSEKQFKALRREEIKAYDFNMGEAKHYTKDLGFWIMKAGECLYASKFWSSERLVYDMDWEDGAKVFYVETDRHY